jgi:general secretion pathway protein L
MEGHDPAVYQVVEGVWQDAGALSNFVPAFEDVTVMAVVAPEDVRCSWFTLPEMEVRQAITVAKLRAAESSLGLVHCSAGLDEDGAIATATIAPDVMQRGLDRLIARGLNPDIVIPFGLVIKTGPDGFFRARMDSIAVVRGAAIAIPDEAVLRDLIVGAAETDTLDSDIVRSMLLTASAAPLVNLREGMFAKRERTVWTTDTQRTWIRRLLTALLIVTMMSVLVTLGKYWTGTASENEIALAAAQKIDPAITDINQAEGALAAALNRQGKMQSSFAPLSAALWRSVKASPNVSVRELRFTPDGILTVVLSAPTADNINATLLAIQQDGFKITALPRQDATGSTLVDVTVRMP